ncbi:hypothetical protein ACFL7E_07070 [Thermodesulfobacteriota bacterium]
MGNRRHVEIIEADLNRTAHQHAVLDLLDAYARDPMGNVKVDSIRRIK